MKKPETANGLSQRHGGHSRGSNLLGVSQYNERLILQLIRRANSLSKAEIARMTRLSAQTVSVIINRLLRDKLLRKQPRQREKGKVGQPAVPITLNPTGAYSIGVKIGRRSLDSLVVDFSGQILQRLSHHYDYPDPEQIFATIERDIATLYDALDDRQRQRIVGIGVAAPFVLGGWQHAMAAPQAVLKRWNEIDIGEQVARHQDLPVWFANDATAACIAELEFGNGARFSNFLYLFIGTFIGGGVVLNGTLYSGASNNAGAIGPMPIPAVYAGGGAETGTVQILECASRYLLEDKLRAAGFDPNLMINELAQEQSSAVEVIYDTWQGQTAEAIAFAITSAISVVDFDGIIIDGALPAVRNERLTDEVDRALSEMNLEGLVRPQLVVGRLGNDARALGGAILPFYANFAPDREVLLKLGVEEIA